MNKIRRNSISKVTNVLREQKDELEMLRGDEQMAYDNLPEGIQMSDRGDEMEEYINMLDEAIDSLEDAIMSIEDI